MITFDETKRKANIAAHRVGLATLTGFFDGEIMMREDTRVAYGESRYQRVGWHGGEMLFVARR